MSLRLPTSAFSTLSLLAQGFTAARIVLCSWFLLCCVEALVLVEEVCLRRRCRCLDKLVVPSRPANKQTHATCKHIHQKRALYAPQSSCNVLLKTVVIKSRAKERVLLHSPFFCLHHPRVTCSHVFPTLQSQVRRHIGKFGAAAVPPRVKSSVA